MKSNISPESLLANSFADQAGTWADECGASPAARELLRRVARAISLATSEGHVCVMLGDIPPAQSPMDEREMRELLLASGVVGSIDAPGAMPLILDDDGRVYLHRYFDYERRLARRLIAAQHHATSADASVQRAQLDALFGSLVDSQHVNWQKVAAALALRQRLTIISGGPGTGKTTTVVNLLACLLEQNPDCRIALTAPTGKAAARMQEAIRHNASHLGQHLQSRLPQESYTVHRLLGVSPPNGRFKHHAGNPLPIDALIVDEASMLDIALAAQLVDAVPLDARIILLGDMNQLSAVEAGAVFSDLSADPSLSQACIIQLSESTGIAAKFLTPSLPRKSSPLTDSVVWFSESFRFSSDSGIGKLAGLINAGISEDVLSWLGSTSAPNITWLRDAAKGLLPFTHALMQSGYASYLQAVQSGTNDKPSIFEAFDRFSILCAVRQGSRGVVEINRQISQWFQGNMQATWFPGRPIIILRNDYVLNLFNGDIGIALPDETGNENSLMVYFPDGQNKFRAIAPSRLPEHETAFAMTVHKAQGSEFDSILLLMPAVHSKVVSRELFYTAVTRARNKVTIVSNEEVLVQAIQSATQRNSGLLQRLADASNKG